LHAGRGDTNTTGGAQGRPGRGPQQPERGVFPFFFFSQPRKPRVHAGGGVGGGKKPPNNNSENKRGEPPRPSQGEKVKRKGFSNKVLTLTTHGGGGVPFGGVRGEGGGCGGVVVLFVVWFFFCWCVLCCFLVFTLARATETPGRVFVVCAGSSRFLGARGGGGPHTTPQPALQDLVEGGKRGENAQAPQTSTHGPGMLFCVGWGGTGRGFWYKITFRVARKVAEGFGVNVTVFGPKKGKPQPTTTRTTTQEFGSAGPAGAGGGGPGQGGGGRSVVQFNSKPIGVVCGEGVPLPPQEA